MEQHPVQAHGASLYHFYANTFDAIQEYSSFSFNFTYLIEFMALDLLFKILLSENFSDNQKILVSRKKSFIFDNFLKMCFSKTFPTLFSG